MDPVADIKARLPIEALVGEYCQLQQKGRNFICICPFHKDTHPSFLVSPDKGIGYCFACQSGGDIFSFYQRIENIDFRQALKDLAERTGVALPDEAARPQAVQRDEKEKLRHCLQIAHDFYRQQLAASPSAQAYLKQRGVSEEERETFGLGLAPDSFRDTYQHLLKHGCSRTEIVAAGLGIQKDLKDEEIYDRFRNRLMFPIHDPQGRLVAFGGRTLGEDDAKYINSSESALYRKSQILFGWHHAREALRDKKQVVMVEGYFDVLACHRIGVHNVVAVSGTALTEEHVRLLRRSAESVVLCLDQDRAGREAAERAFQTCAAHDLLVRAVVLQHKDPDEAAAADPAQVRSVLEQGGKPYIEYVLEELAREDMQDVGVKRAAVQRILRLLSVVPTAVERDHYLHRAAAVFGTSDTALRDDLSRQKVAPTHPARHRDATPQPAATRSFSPMEIALGLFLLYPEHRSLLAELIEPDAGFAASLYGAIKQLPPEQRLDLSTLTLEPQDRERASILQLYCEHHGFADWSEGLAAIEMRKNCNAANRDYLRTKQLDITKQLSEARLAGNASDEAQLQVQYQHVIKLAKMTR